MILRDDLYNKSVHINYFNMYITNYTCVIYNKDHIKLLLMFNCAVFALMKMHKGGLKHQNLLWSFCNADMSVFHPYHTLA